MIGSKALAIPMALALATLASACGSERSAESYCATYWEERSAFTSKYDRARQDVESMGDQDPLAGLLGGAATLAQSLGDTIIIFEKLEKVAPEEIQPDVAAVRDSLKAQIDAVTEAANNPLGALIGGLVQGMTAGGSWQRVEAFTLAHCVDSEGN